MKSPVQKGKGVLLMRVADADGWYRCIGANPPILTLAIQGGENWMIQMKVSESGRVVIPSDIRQKMGLKEGDIVYWEYSDGEARLTTLQARLRRAQAIVKRHVPPGVSLADELIAERRKEAAGD